MVGLGVKLSKELLIEFSIEGLTIGKCTFYADEIV